jgi:hypothetical protein
MRVRQKKSPLGSFFCSSIVESLVPGGSFIVLWWCLKESAARRRYFFFDERFSGLPWVELRAVRTASSSVDFSNVANRAAGKVPPLIAACTAQ